jgi:hypothetical protein
MSYISENTPGNTSRKLTVFFVRNGLEIGGGFCRANRGGNWNVGNKHLSGIADYSAKWKVAYGHISGLPSSQKRDSWVRLAPRQEVSENRLHKTAQNKRPGLINLGVPKPMCDDTIQFDDTVRRGRLNDPSM